MRRADARTLLHQLVPLELFDAVVESARVGHRKPYPAIYRLMLDVRTDTPAHLHTCTLLSTQTHLLETFICLLSLLIQLTRNSIQL